MRDTIGFGIDLGTTNSAVATMAGTEPRIIRSPTGSELLPSAVHFGAGGKVTVGEAAKAMLAGDPLNTALEFKRLMGSRRSVGFPASGSSSSPEKLSSHVLTSLLDWVEAECHERPEISVITVPAIFQLPQCEATREAAKLAGIRHAPLLQEPVAAAIAHAGVGGKEGHWLIYDLGGGTFDASLVRSNLGRLSVVDHDGDNHLGGKDLDRSIAQEAIRRIRLSPEGAGLKRGTPVFEAAFAVLKAEAERVRISLSKLSEEKFTVTGLTNEAGRNFDFEMLMTVDEMRKLIRPTLLRTVGLCKDMLGRNRVSPAEIKGIVLVGGPTLTAGLPGFLEENLGIEARHHRDPMTMVACGAAIFASTQRLSKYQAGPKAVPQGSTPCLTLEFEPMTTNPAPLVVGKVAVTGPIVVAAVKAESHDGRFAIQGAVGKDGLFSLQMRLQPNQANQFKLSATSIGGESIPCQPPEITMIHGLSVAAPQLPQSVGVMLADNSVVWYLRKGIGLPVKRTKRHALTAPLKMGQSGDAINVPLIQGEYDRADRNKVIGILRIAAEKVEEDLPIGTEIDVTISIDEFMQTSASAYISVLERTFDEVATFDMETKAPQELQAALAEQQARLAKLEEIAGGLEGKLPDEENAQVKEFDALVKEGDTDGLQIAEQMVRKMTIELDKWEGMSSEKSLSAEFSESLENTGKILKAVGTDGERGELAELKREFNEAIGEADFPSAGKIVKKIDGLGIRAYSRTPYYWIALFENIRSKISESKSPETVLPLIRQGEKAVSSESIWDLRQVCMDLLKFLPAEESTRVTSQIA